MEYCEQDLVCGIVYIPPLGSKYTNDDPYLEMQEEIFRYCSDRKHVLLFGDFNSRSKALPDYVKLDEYMSDIHGLQELYEENVNILGPVVQSVVSLTSSLRVISLTILADSIYNILIFFAEKM